LPVFLMLFITKSQQKHDILSAFLFFIRKCDIILL